MLASGRGRGRGRGRSVAVAGGFGTPSRRVLPAEQAACAASPASLPPTVTAPSAPPSRRRVELDSPSALRRGVRRASPESPSTRFQRLLLSYPLPDQNPRIIAKSWLEYEIDRLTRRCRSETDDGADAMIGLFEMLLAPQNRSLDSQLRILREFLNAENGLILSLSKEARAVLPMQQKRSRLFSIYTEHQCKDREFSLRYRQYFDWVRDHSRKTRKKLDEFDARRKALEHRLCQLHKLAYEQQDMGLPFAIAHADRIVKGIQDVMRDLDLFIGALATEYAVRLMMNKKEGCVELKKQLAKAQEIYSGLNAQFDQHNQALTACLPRRESDDEEVSVLGDDEESDGEREAGSRRYSLFNSQTCIVIRQPRKTHEASQPHGDIAALGPSVVEAEVIGAITAESEQDISKIGDGESKAKIFYKKDSRGDVVVVKGPTSEAQAQAAGCAVLTYLENLLLKGPVRQAFWITRTGEISQDAAEVMYYVLRMVGISDDQIHFRGCDRPRPFSPYWIAGKNERMATRVLTQFIAETSMEKIEDLAYALQNPGETVSRMVASPGAGA